MTSVPHKTCSTCNQSFPASSEYFHKGTVYADGFRGQCKTCVRKRQRNYMRRLRKANPDYGHEYREAKKQDEEWVEKEKERQREVKRKLREKDREAYNRKHREYIQRNPEQLAKQRINAKNGKARRRNAEGHFTQADIDEIHELQDGYCAYCGINLHDEFHIDHIQPLSRGGTNWPDNLAVACPRCNLSKGDKLIEEWELVRGW